MKKKPQDNISTDAMEQEEHEALKPELAAEDKQEEKAWGIHSDKAAYGRTRIDIPDRW